MKKLVGILSILVIFLALGTVSAAAAVNGTVKVGLRFGSSAVSSANLENTQSGGYALGYYDEGRSFVPLGSIDQTAITMRPGADLGAFEQSGPYGSFAEAASAAAGMGGWPAYASGQFYARRSGGGSGHTSTSVAVTDTSSSAVLFEFDSQGIYNLGVLPVGGPTWFKGYRYAGGFEYPRVTGGGLYVVNVVSLEDYVKGVLPYEMGKGWPEAALQAQAVCARTYASVTAKHLNTYGFDMCNTTDCQVYNGVNAAGGDTDAAVDSTAGQRVWYRGALAETVYHSSDGGATESAENVWGGTVGYLIGKTDPYEATVSIPNYSYTVTYTPSELTWVLQNSGYTIGTVKNAYVSERTSTGNVYKVTFVDTTGKTLTVKGETCRMAFYSTTYGKNVKSMRFSINGDDSGRGTASGYYVNGSGSSLPSLSGAYTVSGSGAVAPYTGSAPYVLTASGVQALNGTSGAAVSPSASSASPGSFVITGTGNGHNVGLSQYGALAMAKQGYSYRDILNFYYTDITVE
ncbi:MAG: SpoIID/LytB domain-containing protein [Oscillibacter sp.]|nr:SpoIID/LytB domain-containing protein [Oscillibacter sp.]MEA4993015.1 SpoIID/LytB domain-containing protein [Oscillibacter sp.]